MGFVQSASGTATSGTSVSATFAAGTGAGNSVIVLVSCAGGAFVAVSSISLTGSSDVFTRAEGSASNASDIDAEIWSDIGCSGSHTVVTVTFTGTIFGAQLDIIEWSGITALDAGKINVGSNNSGASSWSSGSTGTLTQPGEVAFALVFGDTFGTSFTVTGPGTLWTNLAQLNSAAGDSQLAGYQQVSATTALTYSGTFNATAVYQACIAAFKLAVAVAGTAQPHTAMPAPRRKPARGQWRGIAGQAFVQVPAPGQQPQTARRRTPARAFVRFTPVATTNPAPPGLGPAGTVQPHATVPVARRKPARAVWRGITGLAPVQVPAPVQEYRLPPRRRPARAQVRFTPVTTANTAAPSVVNQWAGTFAQPATFGNTPPPLQSTVLALTPASSVGGGTGYPSEGNWLFAACGWNQEGLPAATVGDGDDIHSFWRPGNVTTSTWAVSAASGNTRTSVWYTPNLARAAGDVYAAPDGLMAGMACLVFEVGGLGPWDEVTGIYANYAAAAEALNLALSAPGTQVFVLAAACGDSSTAGQALAPAGWTGLQTVTASNGADHTCDAVLTSAYQITSSAVSVNATSARATDLSGVIIGVAVTGASPIPAGANPAWAGRTIVEAAFGGGFQSPPDTLTWTVLSDSAAARGTVKRFWSWNDRSGIPYALGQLQSSEGATQLDNFDGALSPSNETSPYAGLVSTGVPIRMRLALGTIQTPAGPVTYNRWYVFQRNALAWPERRNKVQRNYVETTLTDIWSVTSGSPPSPFRAEIEAEASLQSWWPADDQPGLGGAQPTVLRNAAPGNTITLAITPSPAGVSCQDQYAARVNVTEEPGYTDSGLDLTIGPGYLAGQVNKPSLAVAQVAQDAGWMYGDPQSGPQSAQSGNRVTAQPGAAAWQQAGELGTGGSNGFFLAANDPAFPPLAGGCTVEGWFNAPFYLGTKTYSIADSESMDGNYQYASGPYGPWSLLELATNTAPVAILQLAQDGGGLDLITYSGSTPTVNTIYSASDLRSASWMHIAVTMTATTWTVYINGGLTAQVSGTATGMTSAWTWLIANGDLGANGGSSPGSIQHGGNIAFSHLAVYSAVLPAWRIRAHYCGALTGFGCLPAPTGLALSQVQSNGPFEVSGWTPDGSAYQGTYGTANGDETNIISFSFSAVVAAVAGSYTSAPSARAVTSGYGTEVADQTPPQYGPAVWAGWTALAPLVAVYTSADAGTETEADTACGSGDSFTAGYGSGAVAAGWCHVAAGTGAAAPSGPSALGDTVGQRIERLLGYAGVTYPGRCVDPAPLLVQAALDTGGQAVGGSIQHLVDSDDGMLFVNNAGNLCYRQRPHLAADTAVWQLGPDVAAGQIPYQADITFGNDPQRVFNDVQITPYSPDGTSLPLVTPASPTAVAASQRQYGTKPYPITSYLQSQARMLAQANWLLAQFGQLNRRVEVLTVDAAGYPPAWGFVAAANVSDVVYVTDMPFGPPVTAGYYRISQISRNISGGANGNRTQAKATVVLDPLPSDYWE